MSGHLFRRRYFGFDDAICRGALLETFASGKEIIDLIAGVPTYSPGDPGDCPDEIKFRVVAAVKEHFRKEYPIIDIDGVRIPFPDGWGLLRPSNTQPVLVLRFEAKSAARLEEIRELVEGVLAQVKQHFA